LRSSAWLWRITGTLALLTTLLFIAGFIYAVRATMFPEASGKGMSPEEVRQEERLSSGDKVQIVALGDSLTRGTGDQEGKGYVGRVRDKMEEKLNKPVYVLANYSVSGYRTEQLLYDVQHRSEVPLSISKADLIMLTIGGNDLFAFAVGSSESAPGEQGEMDPQQAKVRMPEAVTRLEQLFAAVAEANSRAVILYLGLYNPFLDIDDTGEISLVVDEWNRKAFEIANRYPNMIVVPTYDLFEYQLSKYLYSDHFHPNREGYERIAERIMQVLE